MTLKHYIYIAVALALAALGYAYRESLINIGRTEVKVQVTEQVLEQVTEAGVKTGALQKGKDDALDNANKRAQANARTAAAARAELDSLRQSVAHAPSVSGDSCATATDRAAALAAVFGECSVALSEVASHADGHANDAMTLHEAWPTLDRNAIDQFRSTLRTKETK